MRHAESEDRVAARDHDRPITEAGRASAQQVCIMLGAGNVIKGDSVGNGQYEVDG